MPEAAPCHLQVLRVVLAPEQLVASGSVGEETVEREQLLHDTLRTCCRRAIPAPRLLTVALALALLGGSSSRRGGLLALFQLSLEALDAGGDVEELEVLGGFARVAHILF